MAPVITALKQENWAHVRVVATAQHREMLDDVLALFEIAPDIDLGVMRPNQSLTDLTARLLQGLGPVIADESPTVLLAQGDTTTVLAAALAAFYHRVPFCHIEAGLRTDHPDNPFPEEMNRRLTSQLASLHFAPTESARRALLAEGVPDRDIFVTGNTVIDALLSISATAPHHGLDLPDSAHVILMTAHRRENFGAPLAKIFSAVRTLAASHPDLHIVYPAHPNPNVSDMARMMLSDMVNITLCPPLDYRRMVAMMKRAWLILTDSGGLQEEAPALGKPVLVLRTETERPEAVQAGVARLIGQNPDAIIAAVEELLQNSNAYSAMSAGASPFGDGTAAMRITGILKKRFGL